MTTPYEPYISTPAGSSALTAAALWLQDTLLGSVATTIAVVAIAFVGFRMLMGQTDFRRGATVILGCFILFGASSIVLGLEDYLGDRVVSAPILPIQITQQPVPAPTMPTKNYDPYAGASVHRR